MQFSFTFRAGFTSHAADRKVLLAYHEASIRDQTGRPKGGHAQRCSWLTMRPQFAIHRPTERWPCSRFSWLTMRPPFAINWPTKRWSRSKVFLAYHETIRDQTGRPKGGHAQRCSWLTMRPPIAINRPTERWPRSRFSWLTMRPPFAINWPTERWPRSKVLLAYHETICDRTGRPKSDFAQSTPGSPIVGTVQKVAHQSAV